MAVDVQIARFSFICSTGSGIQQIASGLPFTPKAYIIYGAGNTSLDTFQDNAMVQFGMADYNGNQYGQWCMHGNQGSSGANSGREMSNAHVIVLGQAGSPQTIDASAYHYDFPANGIRIYWDDASSVAYRFFGIAFGGTDLDAEVMVMGAGRSTTGTFQYNLNYMSATPSVVFLFNAGAGSTLPDAQANSPFGYGAAVSNTKQFAISGGNVNNSDPVVSFSYSNSDACLVIVDETTQAIDAKAVFSSKGAGYFVLNWTVAADLSSTDYIACLAISGGNWDIGSVAKRTTTGDTVVTTDATVKTVQAIMVASSCLTSSTSLVAHARNSFGCAVSTTDESGFWSGDTDNVSTTIDTQRSESANILLTAVENATTSSTTVTGRANISNMGNSTFTLTYTTATAVNAAIYWIVVGIETMAIADINEPSVSIGAGSVDTTLFRARPIAEPAKSISEAIDRTIYLDRNISGTYTPVGADSVSRWISITKAISETAVTVGVGAIQRIQLISKEISDSAINVSDEITTQITRVKNVIEPLIKYYYSLFTRKKPFGGS